MRRSRSAPRWTATTTFFGSEIGFPLCALAGERNIFRERHLRVDTVDDTTKLQFERKVFVNKMLQIGDGRCPRSVSTEGRAAVDTHCVVLSLFLKMTYEYFS